MPEFYVYFRCWRGFTDAFPFEQFATLPDDEIERAVTESAKEWEKANRGRMHAQQKREITELREKLSRHSQTGLRLDLKRDRRFSRSSSEIANNPIGSKHLLGRNMNTRRYVPRSRLNPIRQRLVLAARGKRPLRSPGSFTIGACADAIQAAAGDEPHCIAPSATSPDGSNDTRIGSAGRQLAPYIG